MKKNSGIYEANLPIEEPIEEDLVKTFSKRQILKSNYYKDKVDVLSSVLDDGERYSIVEVNNMIDEFYGGTL